MKKRDFLTLASSAALLPAGLSQAADAQPPRAPTLLTVGGAVAKGNRKPLDTELDQMMFKHGVRFDAAFAFDSLALQRLPRVNIRPTLE